MTPNLQVSPDKSEKNTLVSSYRASAPEKSNRFKENNKGVRYTHFENIFDTLPEEDKGEEFKMFQKQQQAIIASKINKPY